MFLCNTACMNENQQTIQAYEGHVQEYVDGTYQGIEGDMKVWMDEFLASLSPESRILEIGSAFGRDAAYLQSKGFTVECSDGTQSFVDLLQEKGFNARKLDLINDAIDGTYDLIMANAVLLHFTREQTADVLKKVHASLKEGGMFAFTVKLGDGEEWNDAKLGVPRYFCYWQPEQLAEVVKNAGYDNVDVQQGTTKNFQWLQVIARK